MPRMKCGLLTLLFMAYISNVYAQLPDETTITLKNISIQPKGIEHPNSGVQKIADGKKNGDFEIFHTLWWGISKQDITIEAELDGQNKKLDRIVLSPRGSGYNGIIKKASLWVMSGGSYKKLSDLEGELSNAPIIVEPDSPIKNPEKIKLIITDSYGDLNSDKYMVSLGELQCIMLGENAVTKAKLLHDAEIFSDLNGTSLKAKTGMKEIAAMKVPVLKEFATALYNKTYKPQNLITKQYPYLHPDTLGGKMRIGNGFSKYEGITGIVLNKGENIVFVGETKGAKIKLLVPDWTRKAPAGIKPDQDPAGWGLIAESFNLNEGVNYIHLKKEGLAYIQYFTEKDPKNYPPITVHFPTGKSNGYFDITRGDKDADFNKLLENAISPIMDLRGKYVQVAFPVDSLKKYTWNRGVELVKNYDTILALQRKLMGWNKEGFLPKNHILARVNQHYYMFRDGDGIAFIDWAMKLVADPQSVVTGDPCWGFSHETGHVNQMQP